MLLGPLCPLSARSSESLGTVSAVSPERLFRPVLGFPLRTPVAHASGPIALRRYLSFLPCASQPLILFLRTFLPFTFSLSDLTFICAFVFPSAVSVPQEFPMADPLPFPHCGPVQRGALASATPQTSLIGLVARAPQFQPLLSQWPLHVAVRVLVIEAVSWSQVDAEARVTFLSFFHGRADERRVLCLLVACPHLLVVWPCSRVTFPHFCRECCRWVSDFVSRCSEGVT